MANHLLLLRGGDWVHIDESDLPDIRKNYDAFRELLQMQGRYVFSGPLMHKSTSIKGFGEDCSVHEQDDISIHDGVGGLFIFSAATYHEAVEIASVCPHTRFHGYLELREIR